MNPRLQKAVTRRTLAMSLHDISREFHLSGTDAKVVLNAARKKFNDPDGMIRRVSKLLMHIRKREHKSPGLHKALSAGGSCRDVAKAVGLAPSSVWEAQRHFNEYARLTKRTLKQCLVDLLD